MDNNNHQDLIDTAKELFNEGKYGKSESILNQLILNNCKEASIFQMLGTIYYDQSKFNKAIRAFRRALEIDPAFTDASLGLSIILNDLGRYEEGKKVFEEAQAMLASKNTNRNGFLNEKIAIKHDELGELYIQYKMYNEALEQYYKALNLSSRKAELTIKIVDAYVQLGADNRAIKELQSLIEEFPEFHTARMKLGKIYYDKGQAHLARRQWQDIIELDSNHTAARRLLKQLDEGEGLFELSP